MFSSSLFLLLLFSSNLSVCSSLLCLGVGVVLSSCGAFGGTLSNILTGPGVWMDQLSGSMVLLSMLVGGLSILSSVSENPQFYALIFLSTMVSILFFMCSNLAGFFVFFEAGLLPLLSLIMGWGHQPERLQACVCLVLYTVAGSLPMFILICFIHTSVWSSSMAIIKSHSNQLTEWMWLFFVLGLLVKTPVFGVHGWLPKAHVEAPAAGSMILAGVLLKFGGYGLMRMMQTFNWKPSPLSEFLLGLSVWGGFLSAMICLVQSDLKSLIAYSSVSHMSLVTVGILSCTLMGWSSSVLMMVAHGLSSSVLFGLAAWSYKGFHSRSVVVCKGLLNIFPPVVFLWFLGATLSLGLPPGINFFSEVFLISSGAFSSKLLTIPLGLISLLTAGYCLYMYTLCCHGGMNELLLSAFASPGDLLSILTAEFFLTFSFLLMDLFFLL